MGPEILGEVNYYGNVYPAYHILGINRTFNCRSVLRSKKAIKDQEFHVE